MKKKYTIIALVIGFFVGVAYVGPANILAAMIPQQVPKEFEKVQDVEMLVATTTAGNTSRNATSTAALLHGAKKVTFIFAVQATTTVTASDFKVYVSADNSVPDTQLKNPQSTGYDLYTDFVAVNGTSPTSADTYFTRTGATTVTTTAAKGATTTVAMDLTYGTWRSMVCVASSSPHSVSTCKAVIEY